MKSGFNDAPPTRNPEKMSKFIDNYFELTIHIRLFGQFNAIVSRN
jgi:hypothetical protein